MICPWCDRRMIRGRRAGSESATRTTARDLEVILGPPLSPKKNRGGDANKGGAKEDSRACIADRLETAQPHLQIRNVEARWRCQDPLSTLRERLRDASATRTLKPTAAHNGDGRRTSGTQLVLTSAERTTATQLVLTSAGVLARLLAHSKSRAKDTRRAGLPRLEPFGGSDAPPPQTWRLRGVPAGYDRSAPAAPHPHPVLLHPGGPLALCRLTRGRQPGHSVLSLAHAHACDAMEGRAADRGVRSSVSSTSQYFRHT